jgi:hypothetical protein
VAFTATAEPDVRSVRLDLTVPATGTAATFSRTGPSGVPATVRGWSGKAVVPGAVIARDFEVPIGVPVTYTAVIYNTTGAIVSTQTAAITLTSQGCEDTWITDLARAANTMQVALESLPELEYPVPESVHEIIARRDPIVTSDVAHTPNFELSFLTDTLDDRDRAKALLGNGVPVLLRTPPEDGIGNLYFSVLGYREQRITASGTLAARRFVATGRQVTRPDPILYTPVGVATYGEVKATFATYTDLNAGRANYDAILYSWAGSHASDVVPWPPDDV